MIKIAAALIVKGSDDEAIALDRCLSYTTNHVDKVFITITHKPGEERNKAVEEVCKSWDCVISDFEWVNDFSAARNYNFSQVPKEYQYILWMDADDAIRGLQMLYQVIEENPRVDLFAFNYMYDFDEYKQPTVVHIKNQVVRNDGCVSWHGALHEDFHNNREVVTLFVKGIERIHLTDEKRIKNSQARNVEVSLAALDKDLSDPRLWWNYGNSLIGVGNYLGARDAFFKFIELSNSDEEKYILYVRLADISEALGDRNKSVQYCQTAIGMKPTYPDAYNKLGHIYYNQGEYKRAIDMLSQGLVKKPPYHTIVVYNPREYDLYPMMLLGRAFYAIGRPDQALTCFKACQEMQPENKDIQKMIGELEIAKIFFDEVLETVEKLKKIKTPAAFAKAIAKLPQDMRSNPSICVIVNERLIKTKSSGKDLIVYAGFTELPWCPSYAKKKGVGGSEEAILNLGKEWAKLGWNVTVYCNTGNLGEVVDGVTYRPYWEWNYRDKQDVVILWRSVRGLDYDINCNKIIVDMHDVMQPGEFTPERVAKMYKVMVKTQFHRSFIPNVPDEKIEVVPNGVDFDLFKQKVEKDQFLIVNTSSPDRSMDVLPKLFKKIKEQVPEAKMKWCYGFDLFDKVHSDHPIMLEWSKETKEAMKEAGIENLGRLTQKDAAKLYLEGNILAFPTEFSEVDCITVKKAQACGCIPITTDFAALNESVQHGIKIHSEKTKDNWCRPNQFHFGLEDEAAQERWVSAVVDQLKQPMGERKEMKKWAERFKWPLIASRWNDVFTK